jgi:hypothetical protein
MGNRFCSLLLSLAPLFVGYPASLLADALDTARDRHQTLFDLLDRVSVRRAAAHLAPRNNSELTLMGLLVAVSVQPGAVAPAGMRLIPSHVRDCT